MIVEWQFWVSSLKKVDLKKILISTLMIGTASIVQWILNPIIGEPSFILFYPMVILSSLYGYGWFGIVLSAFIIQVCFLPPKDQILIKYLPGVIKQFVFIGSSLMIHSLTAALRHTLQHSQKVENRLQITLDSIGDAVVSTDKEGRVDFMNPMAESLTEWSTDQASGKPLTEILCVVDPLLRIPIDLSMKVIQSDQSESILKHQMLVLGKSGKETVIEDSLAPIGGRGSHGEFVNTEGIVLAFRDVSEKFYKQLELEKVLQNLQESQEKFEKVIQNVLDGVAITDDQKKIILWNPRAEQILGYTQLEVLGLKLHELIVSYLGENAHEGESKKRGEFLESQGNRRASERIEIYARSKEGKVVPLEVVTTPVHTSKGVCFFYFFKDLTDSKRVESDLIEARNKTELILASAAEGILGVDREGQIIFVNPAASQMLGWHDSSLIGESLYSKIHPGFADEEMNGLKLKHTYLRPIQESLVTGVTLHREDERFRRSDGTYFPVEYSSIPMKKGEQILGLVLTFRDISERKKNEKQILDLMNQLKNALSTRDEFISIASHELKTPLTSLKLHYQLVARQLAVGNYQSLTPSVAQNRIESTNRQIDRMIRLIDDMLDVSRISSGRLEILLEDIDLGQLIKNLLERFSLDFKSAGCLLRLELNVDVRCRCDPLRVEQVLSNLLMNALKYAASKPIEISLTRQEEYAVIAVRDHGEGIPPGKLSRVFEKFERAVSSQHISGFGLGLYISRKIVEAHHGSIHVKSELGQGSLFTVKLPLRAV